MLDESCMSIVESSRTEPWRAALQRARPIFAVQHHWSMLIKTRGIVLRTKKYGESSLIVDVYTEAKGLRSYILGGVRKAKPRVGAALLQATSLVDLVAYHREDSTLTRLKEVRAWYTYQNLLSDIRKMAVGMFMVEVMRKTLRGHEPQTELFELLSRTLMWVDQASQFSNAHLHFLLELSAQLGFQPGGHYLDDTPYFDLQEGIFVSEPPAHVHWLPAEYGSLLSQLQARTLEESGQVKMDLPQRRQLLRYLLQFYRLHIENFPTIHSHQILEEVFS